jgi:multidrug efflux pump subunit AcrA (membrane-fusion protein)
MTLERIKENANMNLNSAKHVVITAVGMLLLSACGASAGASSNVTPTAMPPVEADSAIIAEGRLEPISYAEIAFNASGIVSEVRVTEGQSVKKGETLIRLGGETDQSYAAAQLELVTAQQAYNDLLNSSGTEAAQAVIDLRDAQEAYDKADDYLHYLQDSKNVPQTETRSFLIQTWK